ncbi:helix-hairpin-helix domain-containing protein [Companilactobacillus farciminis]|uniref:helix-hairpin-helix domain-containing protein n=1 Tax=Companilactobacillus farciminis TaxID=1612 RepID=UPI00232DE30B|nr:helix-hairpin-helix domain-containing protein [Companilactobacillus farciminis]WCG34648.1 helix-hairpin-helix domain-containing protein [Companilactobacillus farciminis]
MNEILDYIKQNKLIVIVLSILVLGVGGYWWTNKTPAVKNDIKTEIKASPKVPKKTDSMPKNKLVAVDIQGAVKKPGVYQVKENSLVQTAIQLAGGLADNADTKQINQAKRVSDQMQVYVPVVGSTGAVSTSAPIKGEKVNINNAKAEDFKDVTGIGPKKAEKIIAFREKNGNFKSLHDLTKVSGIGEKSLDSLKDQLTV